MYELKAILGHKSIQMTVDLYGNFQAEDVSKVSPYEFQLVNFSLGSESTMTFASSVKPSTSSNSKY